MEKPFIGAFQPCRGSARVLIRITMAIPSKYGFFICPQNFVIQNAAVGALDVFIISSSF